MKRSGFRRHKYGAIKTTVGDLVFPSKLEATGYKELLLLEKSGIIKDLELQKELVLTVEGRQVCIYYPDYFFTKTCNGKQTVGEAKGKATADFRLKWKLAQILYPDYDYMLYQRNKWSGSFYK